MQLKNLPQREEYLKKKRNMMLLKYAVIGVVLVGLIGLASFLSHRSQIRIRDVELSGGVLLTQDEVKVATIDYLRGSYFWLFPKNNSLWYPKKGLDKYLQNDFQRIDTIKITQKNFHTLSISITERKPFAIWCDTVPSSSRTMEDGSNDEHCYFLDQNSTIFATAPFFSGNAYFKFYGQGATTTPIGTQYIASSTEFVDITNFIDSVRKMSVIPVYLVSKGEGEYSLVLSGGGEIYFDTKEPLPRVSENLAALLRSKALASTSRDIPIEYIDMRYGNKLFYKLKN